MVYAGFRDAHNGTFQTHLWCSQPLTSTMKKAWMRQDARPYQEEMKQAINKLLQLLEKQEMQGFKHLTTLLSHLPLVKPAKG